MALGWRGQYLRYKDFFLNIAGIYKQRPDLRAFLEVFLSLSTIIVFLLFALKPTILTIIGLVQEIREKESTVAALDQKISNLQRARGIFSQVQSSAPSIENAVAASPEIDLIAKQIQGLGAKNGVTISGFSVSQTVLIGDDNLTKRATESEALPEGAKGIPISISIRGEYPNLVSFLGDFENLRLANKIDVLGINASTTESGQVITVTISARIPFLGKQK